LALRRRRCRWTLDYYLDLCWIAGKTIGPERLYTGTRRLYARKTADNGLEDGLITPVNVRLIPDGTTQVQIKEQRVGGTAKGRYGWKTKYSSTETTLFQLRAEAEAPMSYRVKEQTTYAR